ncbi:MAG TPA: haloalkane dehalogenase [Candidatus Limnocylindria bacterium]|nr:haloalkane dehalogenase [Candidatus Limnocylindria bacterium]
MTVALPQAVDLRVPILQERYGLERVRMHYVEAGRGRPILFLHGTPTSSHLWREILPAAARHGRAIAVDLIGHGRSEKPAIRYDFEEHVAVLEAAVVALDLAGAVLVLHDWGGPLGFHHALTSREPVRAIAAMETFPWRLDWRDFPAAFRLAFRAFRAPRLGRLLLQRLNLFVDRVMPATAASGRGISPEALAVYRSFYPTPASRRAVRRWPMLLPLDGTEPTAEVIDFIERRLPSLRVPLLWLAAEPGAITTPARIEWLQENVPGVMVRRIGPAGHYVQEEVPEQIACELDAWLPGVLAGAPGR